MTAWLFAAWLAVRLFHPETVATFARSHHTHVEVVGTVVSVRHEADGDVHFIIADAVGRRIVCEIVPFHPLPSPTRRTRIVVRGIRRFDDEAGHGWWEVHPVESWTLAP